MIGVSVLVVQEGRILEHPLDRNLPARFDTQKIMRIRTAVDENSRRCQEAVVDEGEYAIYTERFHGYGSIGGRGPSLCR